MKKFEEFTIQDLDQLRKEICLNSAYTADYTNSFGIAPHSVASFFDGYYDFLWELAEEAFGRHCTHEDAMHFDTSDNLQIYYYFYDDFDWVKYDEAE